MCTATRTWGNLVDSEPTGDKSVETIGVCLGAWVNHVRDLWHYLGKRCVRFKCARTSQARAAARARLEWAALPEAWQRGGPPGRLLDHEAPEARPLEGLCHRAWP